jgi:hypothetical protein
LPNWYDVDDAATLERLRQELVGRETPGSGAAGYDARHTRLYLGSLRIDTIGQSRAC